MVLGVGDNRNQKERLIPDLDPMTQRRLNAIAAMEAISMRQYCLAAINIDVDKDGKTGVSGHSFGHEALNQLDALRVEILGDGTLPGDSVELIGEACEARRVP